MDRRSFTKLLAAFGAAPALPPVSIPAATAAAAPVDPMLMGLARHYAQAHQGITTAALARRLGINPAAANRIFGHLITAGTITVPDAKGVSQSTRKLAQKLLDLDADPLLEDAADPDPSDADAPIRPA